MSRFDRIAVGWEDLDRDPTFFHQVRDLARAHEAHLELVNVVPGPTHHAWFSKASDPWDRIVAGAHRDRLEHIADGLRDAGVDVHCSVPTGEPHIELIRHAHRTRCDLLYIVDEPRNRGEARSFGPTTRKLLRKCPTPVWAARLGSAPRPRSIVAALDVRSDGDDAEKPNAKILDACRRLNHRDLQLHLVHVWNLWGEELLRSHMTKAEHARTLETAQAAHRDQVETWARRFEAEGLRPRVRIDKGDARRALPAIIDDIGPDLVVMGTLCRTGLPGLIIGNTSERILNRLHCSVLTVKPPGFDGPVPLED